MVHIILFYVISLILGALFINGLFESTQGSTETIGKLKIHRGMILYPLRRLLEKSKMKYYEYEYKDYENFIKTVRQDYPQFFDILNLFEVSYTGVDVSNVLGTSTNDDLLKLINIFEKKYNIEIEIIERKKELRITKKYTVDIVPNWIGKPILLCYKCYSSIYGSILFWLFYTIWWETGYLPLEKGYTVYIMWVMYVFSLIPISMYVHKKIN